MLRVLLTVSFVMLFVTSAGLADDSLPVQFKEDFESGTDKWQPTDVDAWKLKEIAQGNVYSQFKKRSSYEPPHRSPYNISLRKDAVVSDFVLDADVLSTHKDYGHRDVCLFFGYQNPAHFYYVHLGKKTDAHAKSDLHCERRCASQDFNKDHTGNQLG